MTIKLGCIADDYTGATDLSSMLVREGVRVLQWFGVPDEACLQTERMHSQLQEMDAVVIAIKSRSISAANAIRLSLDALSVLQSLGAERFYFKYCSTFDSTDAGNIGPVAESIANELDVKHVWYCPAFPENGRTIYCGHLFVGGVPLHESSMKDHPLNPMHDSNLVRVLQRQCEHPVANINRHQLYQLDKWSPQESPSHWIVDCTDDNDLNRATELAINCSFVTGGSAFGGRWGGQLVGRSRIESDSPLASPRTMTAILSGSSSLATRKQTVHYEQTGGSVNRLDLSPVIANGLPLDTLVQETVAWITSLASADSALVTTAWDLSAVSRLKSIQGDIHAADLVEQFFARLAKVLLDSGVRRFVVAGGETSGAVMNALEIKSVRIGKEISPGVPWVHNQGATACSLALKSGNFGADSFFCDAIACLNETRSLTELGSVVTSAEALETAGGSR